jgi:HK97 family phage prohead protease
MYVKAAGKTARSVEAVLSSETIDGHGEIVDQASWKLERFKRNPVLLYMHSSYSPIGHVEQIRVADGQLSGVVVFATTALADEVFTLFRDGAMRAFSVGFRVGKIEEVVVGGRKVRKLLDCELMEVSAVSIPSNPDAIVRHKSLGLVPTDYKPRNPSKDLLDEINRRIGLSDAERADEDVRKAIADLFPEPPQAA